MRELRSHSKADKMYVVQKVNEIYEAWKIVRVTSPLPQGDTIKTD